MTMRTNLRALLCTSCALAGLMIALPAAAQSAPSDYTSAIRYDAMGRVTGTISADPDGVGTGNPFLATRSSYDARGNLVRVDRGTLSSWKDETIAPSAWGSAFTITDYTLIYYDEYGRKTFERTNAVPGNVTYSVTQFSYDSSGRLECTAVRMNLWVNGSQPSSACSLPSTESAYGPDRITKNVYDAAGQLLQVRKAVGTSLERADVTYTYTSNGKQKYVIDANGNRAELRYDGFDRQVRWVFPSTTRPTSFNDSTPATAVSTSGVLNEGDYELYGYDANGNRTSLRKRDGSTLTYTYDNLNQMTVKVVPSRAGLSSTHTRNVYYGYDLRGLQLYARFDSASTSSEGITTTYDGFGNRTSEAQNLDGATRTVQLQYDEDGNRTRLIYPDTVSMTLEYDKLDRMSAVRQGYPGTVMGNVTYNSLGLPALLSWDYAKTTNNQSAWSYDAVSRLSGLAVDVNNSTNDVAWSLTRNSASQIVSETRNNDAYAWTGHVNLTRGYTTNGLNQYSAAGSASFTYDANGNLISDGTNTYVYDIENRLVSRSGGGTTATLRYDPLGRLYEINGSTTGITRFLNDGDAMVAEYNSSGTMLRRYVHGANAAADDPLIWYEGSAVSASTRRYLHADPRGSIVTVTDYNGDAIITNTYDEYGIPGSGNAGRFQYTGQAWIPELGMYYYKARIYSPTLGRFLQTDPIGYEDQYNLYAYVGNDPVNGTDFGGLATNLEYAYASSCVYYSDCESFSDYKRIDFTSDADTGFQAATFSNGKETIVAFAGTNDILKDGTTDFMNDRGAVTEQYKQAVDYALSATSDSKLPVSFTGHSLGGGLATISAGKTGAKATVFNSASASRAAYRVTGSSRQLAGSVTTNIYVRGEPLTRWQTLTLGSNAGKFEGIGSVLGYAEKNIVNLIQMHAIGHVIKLLSKK